MVHFLFGRRPQIVCQIITFRKQASDAPLTFWNVFADQELAVYSHIVDGIQLHTIRVQLARI